MTATPPPANRKIEPFFVMEIMARAQKLESQGREIQHLEVGELDFMAPDVVLDATVAAIRGGKTGYTNSKGTLELRHAVCDQFVEQGLSIELEQVLVSTGTSPVLFIAMACVADPGDEILLFDPGYSCYPNFAKLLGCTVNYAPLCAEGGFRPDPETIAGLVGPRTKAIVFCTPANPTGVVLTDREIAALAEIGPWLIVDEIYRGIEYTEAASRSALHLQLPNLIVVDGFSKKYAMTGFRLGYGVFPAPLIKTAESVHQSLMISANPFVQAAGLSALQDASIRIERQRWLEKLRQRRDLLQQGLAAMGIDVPSQTDGAFYLLADFRRFGTSSLKLAYDILENAGVAVTPGIDFGLQSEGFLRFSFAKSEQTIQRGLDQLKSWVERQDH